MSEGTVSARWNKDVFVALAAIGWADGTLDPDEADAIVRAAVDLGLELQEIAAIEEATRAPIGLGAIDKSELSKEDRLFVYAIACWIAQLDGNVTDEESERPRRPRRGARSPRAPPRACRETCRRDRGAARGRPPSPLRSGQAAKRSFHLSFSDPLETLAGDKHHVAAGRPAEFTLLSLVIEP